MDFFTDVLLEGACSPDRTVEDFTLNDVKLEISSLMLTRFSKMDQENVQHFVS